MTQNNPHSLRAAVRRVLRHMGSVRNVLPVQITTKMTAIEVRVPVRLAAPMAYSNLPFTKTG